MKKKYIDQNGVKTLWKSAIQSFVSLRDPALANKAVRVDPYRGEAIYYDTFEEAFENAPSNATLVTLKDIFLLHNVILENKNLDIDLNGHTLKAKGVGLIVKSGALTIDNGMIYHTGKNLQAIGVVASVNKTKTNNNIKVKATVNLKPNLKIYCPQDYGVVITPKMTSGDPVG